MKAFYRIYRTEGLYKQQDIKVSPLLSKFYVTYSKELSFETSLLPMVTLPVPWVAPDIGGYLLTSSNLLRLSSNHPEQYVHIKNSDKSDMYPVYDSLNSLGSCPWIINTKVSLIKVFFLRFYKIKRNLPIFIKENDVE
jgi:DNA-directed RNA polymerase